jgi:uncharacterized membrane protein
MTLEPLLAAPLAVRIHVATVLPAFFLGTWQLGFSRKGSRVHRAVGFVYLALMVATSIAAMFIHALNPQGWMGWSPVHLFVPLTLFGVAASLLAVRRHDIAGHKRAMIATYVGALLLAGAFTFMPGRIMHAVVFGP